MNKPENQFINYRWRIVALLFFATTINYIDRQVIGILKPFIAEDLGWSEADYGYIVTAFQIAYAIGLVTTGRFLDRFGTRIGYLWAIIVWSIAGMAHAAARGVASFAAARFILGIGESANFPAAVKSVAEWFPKKERAFATGLFNSGSTVGAIIAPVIAPEMVVDSEPKNTANTKAVEIANINESKKMILIGKPFFRSSSLKPISCIHIIPKRAGEYHKLPINIFAIDGKY